MENKKGLFSSDSISSTGGTLSYNSESLSAKADRPGPVDTNYTDQSPYGPMPGGLSRLLKRLAVIGVFLLVVGGGLIFFVASRSHKQQTANSSAASGTPVEVPLNGLADGSVAGTRTVTINGPLHLNDTFTLTPQVQPVQAVAGQIYYDKTTNKLNYFNGTQFVTLTASVNSISSSNGQIGVTTDASGNVILTSNVVQGGGTGTVGSSGGTAGRLALFTTGQNIENSILSQTGTTVTVDGTLSAGGLSLTAPLNVVNGGTGAANFSANGVVVGNGTGALTSVTAGGTGLCLLSTAGAPQFAACPGGVGQAFTQNGNAFGATAVLGTTDAHDLSIIRGGSNILTVGAGSVTMAGNVSLLSQGSALFKDATNSATAFQVQTAGGAAVMGVDTLNKAVNFNNDLRVNNSNASIFYTLRNDTADNTLKFVNDIIGNPAPTPFSFTGGMNFLHASKFNSGTGGTVSSLNVYFTAVDGGLPHFKVAVYSDSAGTPNTLLSNSAAPSVVATAGQYNNASLGGTVTLAPNTQYWLALAPEGNNTKYGLTNGDASNYDAIAYGSAFPGSWTSSSSFFDNIMIYGTYDTVNDQTQRHAAVSINANSQLHVRPLNNADQTFDVYDRDGNPIFNVDTLSKVAGVTGSVQINNTDFGFNMWSVNSGNTIPIGGYRTTNTGTDNVLELFSDVAGPKDPIFRVQANGQTFADGAYTGTGADYAEYFKADPAHLPQPGDLVALDASDGHAVQRAVSGATAVGIVSTKPGFLGNAPYCATGDANCLKDYTKYNVAVALNGQVPTKVSVANGAIHAGDPITVSAYAGVGQKAAVSGPIIGYAQESTSANGTITILLSPGYYDASGGLQGQAQSFQSINVGTGAFADLTVTDQATIAKLNVTGQADFQGDVAVHGSTSVADIIIGGHIITAGTQSTVSVLAAAGTGAQVKINGNDTSGSVTITLGTGATADDLVHVAFAKAYGAEPRIVLTPVGKKAAAAQPYVDQPDAAGFLIGVNGTPHSDDTYTFTYQTLQ